MSVGEIGALTLPQIEAIADGGKPRMGPLELDWWCRKVARGR